MSIDFVASPFCRAVNPSPVGKRIAAPPPPTDQVELGKTVLANRISLGLNLGAVGASAAVAVGAALLTAAFLPALAVGTLAVGGAVAAAGAAVWFGDPAGKDAFKGLRPLARSVADHLPQAAAAIQPTPAEVRTATHPTLTEKERRDFIAQLQPGDIVLDCSANDSTFMTIVAFTGGKSDWTHAMLYEKPDATPGESNWLTPMPAPGSHDGVILNSTDGGSQRSDLFQRLATCEHVIAIRPDYHGNEKEATLANAVALLGRPYRWNPTSMKDDKLGCAQMVLIALMRGAPESQLKVQKTLGVVFPAPRDFLTLKGSQVVAEAGQKKTYLGNLETAFRTDYDASGNPQPVG